MKLKEVLDSVFKNGPLGKSTLPIKTIGDFDDYRLDPEHLELYKSILMQCDEFKDVKKFEILKLPVVSDDFGKAYTTSTIKLSDDMWFSGRLYLYSISLSPEMYAPHTLGEPVKDGASISPTIYDPFNFTPLKRITLTLNPEIAQDLTRPYDTKSFEYRQHLHSILDDVIDHPEEYRQKGFRSIMIRGIFENVITKEGIKTNKIGFLNLDYEHPKHKMAFWMEQEDLGGGQIGMQLKSKPIPVELEERYEALVKAKRLNNITEKDIEELLDDQ